MSDRSKLVSRAGWIAVALALALGGPATFGAELPAVGSTVPDLTLAALGGGERTLSANDTPTILVFFRGVW